MTVVFNDSFKFKNSFKSRDLTQFHLGDMLFHLKQKWKSKLLQSPVELCLVNVVKQNLQKMRQLFPKTKCKLALRIKDMEFTHGLQVVAGRVYDPVKFIAEAKPLQSLQFMKQDNMSQFLWSLEVFSIIRFHIRRDFSGRMQLLCDVVTFQVWYTW